MNLKLALLLPAFCAGMVVSCSPLAKEKAPVNPRTIDKTSAQYVNPFAPNSYEHFVAQKDYPKTYATYQNKELLDLKGPKKQSVIICIDEQRGRYYVNGEVAMDFPVSTGIKSFPTKTGKYSITEKKTDHSSNLYGKMYDAENKMVDGDAESSDPVPDGGKFVGAAMPYWMRLTGAGLGMHVGKVGRRPLSHGCIRLQRATAEKLYSRLSTGTPVTIQHEAEALEAVPVMPIKTPKKS